MCVGAQTPRSLLVPKRASVCAAERERRGRAYETLAMSPPSSKRKPVLQRRASTCCSARCGGGGTAPSAGGHTRCGRAGRPRSRRRGRRASAATSMNRAAAHEGMTARAAGRGSRAPQFPRATAWCVDPASSSPASQSLPTRPCCDRPPCPMHTTNVILPPTPSNPGGKSQGPPCDASPLPAPSSPSRACSTTQG